ncbi:thrombospondin type 3 repeat-containing protein [Dietzia sp. ANT_WB102]|uniref:thrombospondin type 3 repeat-containing protein n=1 Tax=Dietzia sp. ANT_WB102 TaxID=2597345 RepID=UPI0011ED58DE|nr:thrombospondin type 3 repeat-containing protein [Dietzia sp. ANT_WB102]KAA0918774.1 hypothetical protein FQ137_05480 [Dietzia sp. ANT_WB102]
MSGDSTIPDPAGAIDGTPGVDPCSMSPGESVDRTYFVRNSTNTGRVGRYEVGIGDFVVSGEAEFAVTSTITGDADADSQSVTIYGEDTPQADDSPDRGTMIAALELAPGQSARVVDEVAVPVDPQTYAQNQSVSPRIWVAFTDLGVIDRDGDGLPDRDEDQLGTDPDDPVNLLPGGTVGQRYGPEPFLPTPPDGTILEVDESTLPDGLRLRDGVLTGTPTRAGTFDVEFTVTMPDGATYQSIRRVVVEPASGGGSSDLPDFFWPIVGIGVIGTVVVILGQGFGSLMGSLGSAGSSGGSGGSGGLGGSSSSEGSSGSNGSGGSGGSSDSSGPDRDKDGQDQAGPSDTGADRDVSAVANLVGTDGGKTGKTGQVPVNSVTPREGAPSQEWARANSDVRGSLASTGVGAIDLLLWALTASAAGAALILLVKRRRHDDPPAGSDG